MIKILFLAANPLDTPPQRLDEECRTIDAALRIGEYRDVFSLESHWALRASDLQEALLRHQPHVVHFSGPGSSTSGIVLQNTEGSSHPVSSSALERLFSILRDNLKCVVLSAGFTEQQALALAKHIDTVIGLPCELESKARLPYVKAFYRALGFGRDVQMAHDLACLEWEMEGFNPRNLPRLFALRTDPSAVVFVSKQIYCVDASLAHLSYLRHHIEVRLDELAVRYDTLTKRIAAISHDIGRELDSERKLSFESRLAELEQDRNQVVRYQDELQRQLGSLDRIAR